MQIGGAKIYKVYFEALLNHVLKLYNGAFLLLLFFNILFQKFFQLKELKKKLPFQLLLP